MNEDHTNVVLGGEQQITTTYCTYSFWEVIITIITIQNAEASFAFIFENVQFPITFGCWFLVYYANKRTRQCNSFGKFCA